MIFSDLWIRLGLMVATARLKGMTLGRMAGSLRRTGIINKLDGESGVTIDKSMS
jgi:hypothetical protein